VETGTSRVLVLAECSLDQDSKIKISSFFEEVNKESCWSKMHRLAHRLVQRVLMCWVEVN
jgi:hypothetical protein